MKKTSWWRSFSFFRVTLLALGITIVISYISLRKLVYIGDDLRMGKEKLSAFSKRTRDRLIEKHGAKKFTCQTEDNVSLSGLIIEREKPVGTLLLCHGYRCCKELTSGYVDLFPEYNTVLFDFRAHGENKKSLTTIGCHEHKDVYAVVKWLKKNKPELTNIPFVILGVSMGGASALKATERDPNLCDGLIVDSSFSNLKSVFYHAFVNKSGLPTFPFLYIMEKMFNYLGACNIDAMKPLEAVKKFDKPLLLIHSCIDHLVPVQESLLMYAHGVKTGAKLWIAPECKHGWLHKKYPGLYRKKIIKFIQKRVLKAYRNQYLQL